MKPIDNIYFLITIAVISIGPLLRVAGAILFLIYLGFVIFYCFRVSCWYQIKSLSFFTCMGLLYIILSYLDVLPDAWTRYYNSTVIPRQSYYVLSIYPLIMASCSFWKKTIKSGQLAKYCWISLFFLLTISPIMHIYYNTGVFFGKHKGSILFTGLMNPCIFLFFSISYLTMVHYRKKAKFILPLIVTIGLIDAGNFQTKIILVLLPILTFFSIKKIGLKFVFPLALILSLFATMSISKLVELDPNVTHRTLMWLDAAEGLIDTRGIGIGFGKEVVTGFYYELNLDRRPKYSPDDIMYEGIHNSFFSIFFRQGVLGGAAFIIFFVVYCFPRIPLRSLYFRHASFVFIVALLSAFVNVGIESPMAILGIVQCLGYIIAHNHIYSKAGIASRAKRENMAWIDANGSKISMLPKYHSFKKI